MPKARSSNSRRRINRFQRKYIVPVVPLRFKLLVPATMEKGVEQWLIYNDELEKQCMEVLAHYTI